MKHHLYLQFFLLRCYKLKVLQVENLNLNVLLCIIIIEFRGNPHKKISNLTKLDIAEEA